MNFAVAMNVFPLSDRNFRGRPLVAANRLRHLMNVSVDKSVVMSRCTARVTRQVKRQIHALLVLVDPNKRMSVEWAGKIYTSACEGWLLSHSKRRQRWWWRRMEWNSFKPPAYDTAMNDESHQALALHDPKLPPDLSQGFLHPIMPDTIMCIPNDQGGERVTPWKQHRMLGGIRDFCVSESPSASPESSVINEELKLILPCRETLLTS